MDFFRIENIVFSIAGYDVSYLELFGMLFGVIAISLSARASVWNWPIGVVNVVLSFFLFYQVQLYPDMLLQVFYLITNLVGWWRWLHPRAGEEDRKRELKISTLSRNQLAILILGGTVGTSVVGTFSGNLHAISPVLFSKPSAFPYLDSFILVMSVITTFFVIQKKIESWIVWILVDLVAMYVYFQRELLLYALLYLLFCFIAMYGLIHWYREYRAYAQGSRPGGA